MDTQLTKQEEQEIINAIKTGNMKLNTGYTVNSVINRVNRLYKFDYNDMADIRDTAQQHLAGMITDWHQAGEIAEMVAAAIYYR